MITDFSLRKVRVSFDSEEMATLAYRVLSVDREPDRSPARRVLSVDGIYVVA